MSKQDEPAIKCEHMREAVVRGVREVLEAKYGRAFVAYNPMTHRLLAQVPHRSGHAVWMTEGAHDFWNGGPPATSDEWVECLTHGWPLGWRETDL